MAKLESSGRLLGWNCIDRSLRNFPYKQDGCATTWSVTKPGHANPIGVSYFCGAEEERTAVAEVRPHQGALATIGEGETLHDLKLIDLTAGMAPASPFECSEGYLRSLVESCEFCSTIRTR
jgi:hypothetical protein